jgi:hypothetical protein
MHSHTTGNRAPACCCAEQHATAQYTAIMPESDQKAVQAVLTCQTAQPYRLAMQLCQIEQHDHEGASMCGTANTMCTMQLYGRDSNISHQIT